MSPLVQIVMKTREAMKYGGTRTLSTGEAVAAALVLNRADWLSRMEYTIPEAIEQIGPEWAACIPAAARILKVEKTASGVNGVPRSVNPEHPTFQLLVRWAGDPEKRGLYEKLSAGFSAEFQGQVEDQLRYTKL